MNTQNGSRQQQILTLLLNTPDGLSIDEMAFKLNISRNAVKQHLVILEKQQLVREAALTSTGGRPARSYTLTEKGINSFPKQYAWFCNLLLNDLAAEMSSEALDVEYGREIGAFIGWAIQSEKSAAKTKCRSRFNAKFGLSRRN